VPSLAPESYWFKNFNFLAAERQLREFTRFRYFLAHFSPTTAERQLRGEKIEK
jgi:hypothetical protein